MKLVAISMVAIAASLAASADTKTLSNTAADAVWNSDSAWSGGTAPAAGDDVLIAPTADITVSLSGDVTADYRSLTIRPATSTSARTTLTFDAGEHSLLMPYSADGRYDTVPFVIADGGLNRFLGVDDSGVAAEHKTKAAPVKLDKAKFKLSQTDSGAVFRLERGTFNAYDPEGTAYAGRQLKFQDYAAGSRFEAVGGSVLEWPSIISGYDYAGSFMFDRVTVNIHGDAAFGHSNRYHPNGTTIVSATNSTINVQGTMGFYGKIEHLGEITNTFIDCDIAVGALAAYWGANAVFRNCTLVDSGTMTVGGAGSRTDVVFDGGEYSAKAPKIGYDAAAHGRLSIRGGAVVEFGKYATGDTTGQHIGWRGTGVVDVVNGTLRTEAASYVSLYVGAHGDNYGTGSGVLNVYEGGQVAECPGPESWAAGATVGIAVGGIGRGVMNVYGGDVRATKLHVGYTDSCRHSLTQELHQTGGRIHTDYFAAKHSYVALSAYPGSGSEVNTKKVPQRAAYYFDGGVLETARIYGGLGSACQGGSGYSKFSADGGIFVQNMSPASYSSIEGLDLAEFGESGLVFDSNGYDVNVSQNLVNKPGAAGRFVKAGAGTLTYTGACDVASLVVSGGVFKVAPGATVSSRVSLLSGSSFSLAGGADAIALGGLVVTNAEIVLDPGDKIIVDGAFSASGLVFAFTSAPAQDVATDVLEVAGEIDESTARALRRAYCDVALAEGLHTQISFAYDGVKTTVTATVKESANPIDAAHTVSWSGSGSWGTASNWTPATVPDETMKAEFGSAGASKAVAVDGSATAGAVSFAADGYTLSGAGSLAIAGEVGAAEITAADETVSSVEVPVLLDAETRISVGEGARLAIAGGVDGIGFRKDGAGTLALSGAGEYSGSLVQEAGVVEIASSSALGDGALPFSMLGGRLVFDNAGKTTVNASRVLSTEAGTGAVVLEAGTTASIPWTSASGKVVKRGTSGLSLGLDGNTSIAQGEATEAYKWSIVFDENGMFDSANSEFKGSLAVAEGLFALVRRAGAEGTPKLTTSGDIFVGGIYAAAAADPVLELDNVALSVSTSGKLIVGGGMGSTSTPGASKATLRLKNGAEISTSCAKIGDRTLAGAEARLELFGSTFTDSAQIYLGGSYGSTSVGVLGVDSTITYGDVLLVTGNLHADFTNTVVKYKTGGDGYVQYQSAYNGNRRGCGYMRLAAGSTLMSKGVKWSNDAQPDYIGAFRLVFDGAAWDIGGVNVDLSAASASTKCNPALFSVECQDGGLDLAVDEGKTFYTECRFTGVGGVVKSGAGDMKFGDGAYQLRGCTRAVAGAIDLSEAGLVTNAFFGGGAGVVKGGTFGDVRIRYDGGSVPVFEDCTFNGRIVVDFGRTAENPLMPPLPVNVTVARFVGTTAAPSAGQFRIDRRSTGHVSSSLGGRFVVEGGEAKMTVAPVGAIMIIF